MTPKNEALAVQLRSLPQQVILLMTGKTQTVELQRFTTKWGIPIAGRTVDLFSVMRSMCAFFEKHGSMLSLLLEETTDDPDGPLMVELLRARIAKLQADARLSELRLAERENQLCARDQVHQVFELIASRFLRASDQAQKKWSSEGFEFFRELAKGMEDDFRLLIEREGADGEPSDSVG